METNPRPKWLVKSLDRAIANKMPVTITYRRVGDGQITIRTVEPYDMYMSKEGHAMLASLDRDTGSPRTFRLANIDRITIHTRGHWLLEH